MFVLLPGLWPRWRIRALALAEVLASVSEMVTSTLHPARSRRDPTACARARKRVGLLFGLATGRVQAIRRCEPAGSR
jgi:hypothetical protein